jgi:hypothetical protein
MVEPVRQHFQHKCLRERGYVFEKIFVGAGTIWLGIVQQVSSGSRAALPTKRPACPESPQFRMRPDEASQSGFGGRIIVEMPVRGAA